MSDWLFWTYIVLLTWLWAGYWAWLDVRLRRRCGERRSYDTAEKVVALPFLVVIVCIHWLLNFLAGVFEAAEAWWGEHVTEDPLASRMTEGKE